MYHERRTISFKQHIILCIIYDYVSNDLTCSVPAKASLLATKARKLNTF